jgi:hypothetical protein
LKQYTCEIQKEGPIRTPFRNLEITSFGNLVRRPSEKGGEGKQGQISSWPENKDTLEIKQMEKLAKTLLQTKWWVLKKLCQSGRFMQFM